MIGIEIHEETLNHCQQAVAAWRADTSTTHSRVQPLMHFIRGNGLNIRSDVGESIAGFDRIYAGAAINSSQKLQIQKLLSPGGVMVAPVDDELLKIIRTPSSSLTDVDSCFTTQTISGVTFAPLLAQPQMSTTIPAAQWNMANHHLYPDSFKQATKTLLLCRNPKALQPLEKKPKHNMNLSALLPKEVWLNVLSFTTRRCM